MDLKPPAPSSAADDNKLDAPKNETPMQAETPGGASVEDAMKQVSDMFNNAPAEPVAPVSAEPSVPVVVDPLTGAVTTPEPTPELTPSASTVPEADTPPTPAPEAEAVPEAPIPSLPSSAPDPVVIAAPVIGGVAASAAQKSKKPKWFMKVVVATGAVLVLAGGSAAAYFGYVVPNKPENILKTALFNTIADDSKTAYLDGDFSVTGKDEASGDFTIKGTLTGKGDNETGAFDVNIEMDAYLTKLQFDARSVDGKTYFVKVAGLSGLYELLVGAGVDPSISTIINSVDDQWLEINESLINELYGSSEGITLSEADIQKLAEIYKKHGFIKLVKELNDDTVKGASSYHYQVAIDKAELKVALNEVKNAKIKALPVTQDTVDAMNDALKDVDLDKYPFDLWIDKETKLINQVGMTIDSNDTKFTFKVALFDLGKPVKVEKPEETKSILEVIGEAYSAYDSLMGGASSTTEDALFEELQSSGISL